MLSTNSGSCFPTATTAPSWTTTSTTADFRRPFLPQMVGSGAEKTVIKWNRVLANGKSEFNSTDILINRDGSSLDTPLTYKLQWLHQSADATLLKVGQQPPPSSYPSVWDPNNGPGGVVIERYRGDIIAKPTTPGVYTAWLIAVDAAGPTQAAGIPAEYDEVLIKRWVLNVKEFIPFRVESFERDNSVLGQSKPEVHNVSQSVPRTAKNCAFTKECSISQVVDDSLKPAQSSDSRITYTSVVVYRQQIHRQHRNQVRQRDAHGLVRKRGLASLQMCGR